jgi:cell division protein FtsI (penicillin-binding protein 3)
MPVNKSTKPAQEAASKSEDEEESPPDGDVQENPTGNTVMPNFRGMSIRRVLQVMEKRSINIRLIGSGRAAEQSPPPGQPIRGADKVWIKFTPSA